MADLLGVSTVSPVGPGGGGRVQVRAGGPVAAVNSRCQASAQGQAAGRRRVERRADRVTRAARLINCRRRVAVVALAWKLEASAPAARVRLNAIAARTSQAEFAAKLPEGRCARAEFFRSAMTCSMIA